MQDIKLENVLYNAFQYYTSKLYTTLPCIVLGVDLATQKVDVQPCINQKSFEGDSTEHPPILGVPLVFPSSKTSAFTFPVNKGDIVLCLFSQRTLDVFKGGNGLPNDPNDFRRFDKRDAIAIPGLFPFQSAINNQNKRTYTHSPLDTVVVHNLGTSAECEIRMNPSGDVIVNSPSKVIINATNNVEVNTQASANVTAAVSANVTSPVATIVASSSYTVTSPTMTFNGNMVVNGNFTMTNSGTYTATFNGDISSTGTIINNGKHVDSTHTHPVSGIQTGSSTITSQVPT